MNKDFIKMKTLYIEQFNNDAAVKILKHIYELTEGSIIDSASSNEEMRAFVAKREVWREIRLHLSDDIRSKVENNLDYKHKQQENTLPPEKTHPYLRNKERQTWASKPWPLT